MKSWTIAVIEPPVPLQEFESGRMWQIQQSRYPSADCLVGDISLPADDTSILCRATAEQFDNTLVLALADTRPGH